MNREYTPTNTLQNYVSKMTLDKNNDVYLSDTSTSSSSPFSPFSSIFSSISTVVIIGICIIFLLAYFNINLFTITGDIIQVITDRVTPIFLNILKYFGIALGTTAVVTTTVASSGISDVVNTIDTSNKAIAGAIVSSIQDEVNESARQTLPIHNTNDQSFNIVNTAPQIIQQRKKEEVNQYLNSIQYNKPIGYCFIGEQNNQRYCSDITEANQCASGDIFPTMDICINPNIRVS
jgi:hypothetical protein